MLTASTSQTIFFPPPELSFGVSAGATNRTVSSAVHNHQSGGLNTMYQTLACGNLILVHFFFRHQFGTCKGPKGVWEGTEKAMAASLFLLINTITHWRDAWVMQSWYWQVTVGCYWCYAEEDRGLTRQEWLFGPMS